MKKIKNTLLFIQVFNITASNLLGPVYAVYVKKIGGNLLTAGVAYAISMAVIGTLIVVSGRFASKYHTEKLQLIIGYTLAIFVAFGYMIIRTPFELFLLEILAGLSIAISQPAFSGIYSSRAEVGKHTSSWGDYLGMAYWAAAAASLYAGYVSQRFGFSSLFISMMILNGLSALGAIYYYFLTDKK